MEIMGNMGASIFPLTLTLSLKGEGTDCAQLPNPAPVFSLSLWERGRFATVFRPYQPYFTPSIPWVSL
jgi:hypothetical protein